MPTHETPPSEQGDLFGASPPSSSEEQASVSRPHPHGHAPTRAASRTSGASRRTGEGLPRQPSSARPAPAARAGVATPATPPLSDRLRPRSLDDLIGMRDMVGEGTLIRQLVEQGEALSVIFWGPPGSGKTSFARLLVATWKLPWTYLSAVTSGIAEVREVFARATETLSREGLPTVVFVDEIHRFNKAQQDAFLPYVEAGTIVLLGATTENPSFSVIAPLLSRCRVLILPGLDPDGVRQLIERALEDAERGLGHQALSLEEDALETLVWASAGDARRVLNALEAAARGASPDAQGRRVITRALIAQALGGRYQRYERAADSHFHILSAFHKSLRGSDPDAAVYWLVRLIDAGEDPLVPARRMLAMAAEDIGLADPRALQIAQAAYHAYSVMGSPEGDLVLTEAAIYLACAPKSVAAAKALWAAREAVDKHGSLPVPTHLRNPVNAFSRQLGYGADYQYAHDFDGAWVEQQFLPDALREQTFYHPTDRGEEPTLTERLRAQRTP
jgi:putative ATPase